MSTIDPYLGEIRLVGFNFPPQGWLNCEGQLLAISENEALFALLGTMYGGDGRTTFALPDLRGRVPVGQGQGPGLSNVEQGQRMGAEEVTLTVGNLPSHSHNLTGKATATATATVHANSAQGTKTSPTENIWSAEAGGSSAVYTDASPNVDMASDAVDVKVDVDTSKLTLTNTGRNKALSIQNPGLGLRWVIATEGVFPPRN